MRRNARLFMTQCVDRVENGSLKSGDYSEEDADCGAEAQGQCNSPDGDVDFDHH